MTMTVSDRADRRSTPTTTRSRRTPTRRTRRLRDEAPLHHNEEHDFWVLSRHADVARGGPQRGRLLQRHGRLARQGRLGPGRPQGDVVPRAGPAAADPAAHAGVERLHAAPGRASSSRRSSGSPTTTSTRALDVRTTLRLDHRLRRPAADGRHLRADGRARGRPRRGTPPGRPARAPRGRRARRARRRASRRDHAVRLLRRHARRSGSSSPTDDLTSALLARRGSTATGSTTRRSSRSSSSWSWPATRPPPSCSATRCST